MLEPNDIAFEDAAYWADLNRIKLQGGQWSFDDHPFLKQILQIPMLQRMGKAPLLICVMKATQLGFTEAMVLIVLHGQIHKHYPRGVLYLFPTNDEVREFSKTRFNPLISANPTAIGQYVTDTDTATLKNVRGSMLYFRGARLSQHLEVGTKDSSKLSSIPVDSLFFDELDKMEFEDVIAKAQGRLGASKVGTSFFIANPSLPNRGIALLFEESDQRHWHRKCGCGEWTCAEEHFPDLIGKDKDGKGYIACKKCGKPTDFRVGQWVPKYKEKSDYMWGYQLSQLASAVPINDPINILRDYNNPPGGNLGDIVRMRLGKSYISAQDRLTTQQILSLCSLRLQADSHDGPCAMGIDVREHKNIVIGSRSGKNRYSIQRVARMNDWDDILRMANRFHVRFCVVDSEPYTDSARAFQKKAKFKVYLCKYRESAPTGTQWNENSGLVTCGRTEIFDSTHRWIAEGTNVSLPADCPEIRQFAEECCRQGRAEVIDRKTNTPVFRYVKLGTGPDDYRNALNYFRLAVEGGHLAIAGNGFKRPRQTHAINEYARN
jgi:hypothetical protein